MRLIVGGDWWRTQQQRQRVVVLADSDGFHRSRSRSCCQVLVRSCDDAGRIISEYLDTRQTERPFQEEVDREREFGDVEPAEVN